MKKELSYLVVSVGIFAWLGIKLANEQGFNVDSFIIIICYGMYLLFQVFIFGLLFTPKVRGWDKIIFYTKSVIISVVSICYIFNIFDNVKYLSSFIGVSLIIDVISQIVKLYTLNKKDIDLKNLKAKGINLEVNEAKNIINQITPDYKYGCLGKDKKDYTGIDDSTFERLKDIYIASSLLKDDMKKQEKEIDKRLKYIQGKIENIENMSMFEFFIKRFMEKQ